MVRKKVQTLSDSERRAWVRLARTENVGPFTFAGLIARFRNAEAALAELPRMAARGGGKNSIYRPKKMWRARSPISPSWADG